jgi:hypothetical protein
MEEEVQLDVVPHLTDEDLQVFINPCLAAPFHFILHLVLASENLPFYICSNLGGRKHREH